MSKILSVKELRNVKFKGQIVMDSRTMPDGYTRVVPVGYVEPFKPTIGDLPSSQLKVASK